MIKVPFSKNDYGGLNPPPSTKIIFRVEVADNALSAILKLKKAAWGMSLQLAVSIH